MAGSAMTKGQRRARVLAVAVVLWIVSLVVLIALGYGRAEARSAVAGGVAVAVAPQDLGDSAWPDREDATRRV